MPHHENGEHAAAAGPPPLNRLIFAGSSVIHREAERRPFQVKFLKAELSREAYVAYLGRLYTVYEALEETDEALKDDVIVGAMYSPELHRLDAIEADLRFFAGDDWRAPVRPTPATDAYVERFAWARKEIPAAYVAHQWLRYLGNVLAQPVLTRIMRKAYGLTTDDGLRFYLFEHIADPREYLGKYHARMNALPLDDTTKRAVVDEGNRAFQMQIDLVDELGAEFGIGTIDADETERILSDLAAEHP